MKNTNYQTALEYVEKINGQDHSGHDLAHIKRVVKMAREIAATEAADFDVIELAALLHDTIDDKVVSDPKQAVENVTELLNSLDLTPVQVEDILDIIQHMSYAKNIKEEYLLDINGQIVQDADRLDALGAIGIGRAFYYSGHVGEPMYIDPETLPPLTAENYRTPRGTIQHFYDKLFKLPDLMNTHAGQEMALERKAFMEDFVQRFKSEWNA